MFELWSEINVYNLMLKIVMLVNEKCFMLDELSGFFNLGIGG